MNQPITIIIAEDQKMVRKGLIALIHEADHLQVIGEANNGKELLELLKTLSPDIVLLDIEMPLMNGKETLELIRRKHPGIKVIMLSMYADSSYMTEFMTMGASAFIPKGCDVEILIDAIETVKGQGTYFNTIVSETLLNNLQNGNGTNKPFDELSLTEREIEILKEICKGNTNKQIADNLHITYNTVDFHRGNIYAKTKSKNVTDLVRYAIRNGIISAE
jgi:DNA-binding NarL/FixJ family response regulator